MNPLLYLNFLFIKKKTLELVAISSFFNSHVIYLYVSYVYIYIYIYIHKKPSKYVINSVAKANTYYT